MKMPKKMRDKWVKALRSGEYGQCKNTLTDGKGSFCCLGVLEHVVSDGSCEIDERNGEYYAAPSQSWCRENGIVTNDDAVFGDLMDMNDGVNGMPARKFSTIATWIEKNVEIY